MKKPSNWENVKAAADRIPLPPGAYLVKIIDAREEDVFSKERPGEIAFSVLKIGLDIIEGDFSDFYQRDYEMQQREDKRWKGVLRQYMPKDDGTERDNWTVSRLKALVAAIEESNPGYHFDWDPRSLKGKTAGCLFREEEWAFNGRTGWKTQPFKLISTEELRKGKYNMPERRYLAPKKRPADINIDPAADSFAVIADDEDLPF